MPDTTEQCQITKVTIRIGEKEQTISIDEARSLKVALEELFGSDRIEYVFPATPLPYVPAPAYSWPPDPMKTPIFGHKIHWTCKSADTVLMSIGEPGTAFTTIGAA